MDTKPLALMIILLAVAASEPARLFGALVQVVMSVLKPMIH